MEMAKKNASYKIVKYEMYREQENGKNYVVLGHNEKTNMWVTWECTDGNNFYWGHYFTSKTEAMKDYYSRLADKYNRPWEV